MGKEWETPELNKKYSEYKSRAKLKGIEFDMFKFLFYVRCIQPCYICKKKDENLNGVDRINNNGGYTQYNTASCCWECNRAKNDMSLSEFEDWLIRLGAKPSDDYEIRKHKMKMCEKWNTSDFGTAHLKETLFIN